LNIYKVLIINMGPPRFELGLLPPRGRRMPSYPTGPKKGGGIRRFIFFIYYIMPYGFQIGPPMVSIVFPATVLIRTDAEP